MEVLERIPVFARCVSGQKILLADRTQPIEFPPGSVLIRQGDSKSAAMIVFIAAGTAEVWVDIPIEAQPPAGEKRDTVIAPLGAGAKPRTRAKCVAMLNSPFFIGEVNSHHGTSSFFPPTHDS
jgi:hypothetical protein